MKTLEMLQFAILVMLQINDAHNFEIFMDIELNQGKEEIRFDIARSQSHHAMDLARILNLTYYPKAAGNEIIHLIIP